jgi:hypothetical protein
MTEPISRADFYRYCHEFTIWLAKKKRLELDKLHIKEAGLLFD